MIKKKYLTDKSLRTYEKKINKEISMAFKFADESKFPQKKILFEDIYAK